MAEMFFKPDGADEFISLGNVSGLEYVYVDGKPVPFAAKNESGEKSFPE